MGLFKRIYDWLLSLFWYARSVVSLFLIYMLIEVVFGCRGNDVGFASPLLLRFGFSATMLESFVLTATMLMPCACAMQEYRDGHHHDRPSEPRQDFAAAGTGGESSWQSTSRVGVSDADAVIQGGEFTIE